MISEHHLDVRRTARYAVLGIPGGAGLRELWIVCHGYGQLAGRFIKDFTPIARPDRLVVAPEALSRFYLETGRDGRHSQVVGASWMTRSDRENEIADNLEYLDSLRSAILSTMPGPVALTVLGFSQGAALAARWVALSRVPVSRLIAWGAPLPPDVGGQALAPLLQNGRVFLVAGTEDRSAGGDALDAQATQLAETGLQVSRLNFPGGHVIDADTLCAIANAEAP